MNHRIFITVYFFGKLIHYTRYRKFHIRLTGTKKYITY